MELKNKLGNSFYFLSIILMLFKAHYLQSNSISLFISLLNQGLQFKKELVLIPYTHVINELTTLFYKKQYISSYTYITIPVNKKGKKVLLTYIKISLSYYKNNSVYINRLKSHFLPSRKLYVSYNQLLKHPQRYRDAKLLLSTSRGFLWIHECLLYKIGGFLLFEIV